MSADLHLRILWAAEIPFVERDRIAQKAGENMAGLLEEIAHEMDHDVKYRARIVSYVCDGDGCPVESTKAWRDGWTRREDGADLCPECSP